MLYIIDKERLERLHDLKLASHLNSYEITSIIDKIYTDGEVVNAKCTLYAQRKGTEATIKIMIKQPKHFGTLRDIDSKKRKQILKSLQSHFDALHNSAVNYQSLLDKGPVINASMEIVLQESPDLER